MSELLGGDYLGAVRGRVADLGLSVVYEPESSAVVEYVKGVLTNEIRVFL
jgi:hypothetical protein